MGTYSLIGRGTGSVELSTVTRAELYSRARQLGVSGRSRMNKVELAWAVRERGRQAVQAPARQRRSRLLAATPAVFRALAWRSYRMIPSLAAVMLSAAIGATTPMLLVDLSGELGDVTRAALPTAYAQPAPAQPKPAAVAASAPAQRGVPSTKRADTTIVLAEASGDSSTRMGSASQPTDKGTEAPPEDSGPSPSPPQAGDDDESGDDSDDPGGGPGDPGDGDGSGDESDPRQGTGSDDRSDGDADEHGKGKGKEGDKGKGIGEDSGRDNGHGKGKDRDQGKSKEEGEG
jgi:hypothetical protein